jgi:hypothetical protein
MKTKVYVEITVVSCRTGRATRDHGCRASGDNAHALAATHVRFRDVHFGKLLGTNWAGRDRRARRKRHGCGGFGKTALPDIQPGKSSCPAANRTAHSLPSVYGKASTHPPGAPAFFLKPLKAKQLHASSAFNCSFQVQPAYGIWYSPAFPASVEPTRWPKCRMKSG